VVPPPSPPSKPPSPGAAPDPLPTPLRVLVGLLELEAALMIALGAVLAVGLATARRQTEVGFTLAEIGLCLLAGVALAFMGRGLLAGRRWPRSPAITLQLVGLPFGGRLIEFGGWLLALPMLAVLLATLVLLFVTASERPADSERAADSEGRAGPDAE
jgi:hypothetical protein